MLGAILVLGTLQASVVRDTIVLSLEDAAHRALTASPLIESALGEVRRAQGIRSETGWPFATNPEVSYSRTRRRAGGSTSYDHEWKLSQEVEIAGQPWLRRGAASALLHATSARVEDSRRVVALEARRSYVLLAIAERRAELADSVAAFADRLAGYTRRQFEAGEANRLELNVALLERARALSTADRLAAEQQAAAAELRRLLGVPGDSAVRTLPLPALPALAWGSDSALLSLARSRRPDLRTAAAFYQGARSASALAGRALIPNLVLSLNTGEEAGTDRLVGVGIGVRVPLFYRQQAAKGGAAADLAAAHARFLATERGVRAELETVAVRYRRARTAEQRFATEALGAVEENVALTERALQEGEVSLTEVLLLRRTSVEAQLEYLEVLTSSYFAWFELAATLGAEPNDLPALLGGTEN